jgi:GAF domain-containing protein/anti-sigma regulatory factor (Ser/Thr protein kinase)
VDSVRDPERVAAVRATRLLDTGPEELFDRLAALAAALLDAPFAFLTLVDDRRSFWKSSLGVDPAAPRQAPLDASFCRHVVEDGGPLLVGDARADRRLDAVGSLLPPGVLAWAGHPIRSAEGHVLGALCVGDATPRAWTSRDADVLAALASAASSEVGLRAALTAGEADGRRVARLARVTAELSEALTPDDVVAIALRETASVLDGAAAVLCVLAEDELRLAASAGLDADVVEPFRRVPVDSELALTRCLREGEAIWIGDPDAWRRQCPSGALLLAERAPAAALVPLTTHRATLGVVMILFDRKRDVPAPERALAVTLARQCAQALERARLYAAETSARERMERLQRMTAALAATLDEEDVARQIVSEGMAALGAVAGVLMLREPDGARVLAATGYPDDVLAPGQRLPLDAPLPLIEVLRTGEPFWLESAADWPARFAGPSGGLSGVAVGLPLSVNGSLTGAVAFRFSEEERSFSPHEREHALALAAQCSSALERARLHHAEQRARMAAERAEDRARLLADVSLALDAPVGLARRFDALVRAVVPRLADFCTVRAIDEHGNAPLVAYAHADAAKQELVGAAFRNDHSLRLPGGPTEVIRSGEAVLVAEVPRDRWDELPPDEEFRARVRELAPSSYIGVPLIARGRAIGALSLVCAESGRRFTEEHRDLAVEIGRRAGLALDNATLYEGQRQVAETLQEALLPLELPAVAGGALARRYVASAEPGRVGGDWYDAIPLPDGRILLCVGDVVGRGPQAAAVMGQLRSAVGILAAEDPAPGTILDRLAGFATSVPDAMGTTAALCLLDVDSGELHYACAGHPPPLVVPADGEDAALLWEGRSPPLGLATVAPRPQARRALAPADTLLLYTDGLVERPQEAIDASLERLRRAAATARATTPDTLCDALLATLAPGGSDDDTALLALRLAPAAPAPLEVDVPAVADELAELRLRLSEWLRGAGAGSAADDVVLACSEAAANCVEHAYLGRPRDQIRLSARLEAPGVVALEVRDTGRWRASPAPGDRGRGLDMMRATMDSVVVTTDAAGTVVRMARRFGDAAGRQSAAEASGARAPDPPGRIEISRDGGGASGGARAHARLAGAVDAACAAALAVHARRELPGGDELTVDLLEVPFLDSAGARLLVELIDRAGADPVRLVVRDGSPAHRAIKLSGLGGAPGVEVVPRS